MNKQKLESLKKNGWMVGTVTEFLGLSLEEEAYVEMRVAACLKKKKNSKIKG